MNQLSLEKRAQIIELLVEGVSIRSAARITKTSHNTVMRLLESVGKTCLEIHDEYVRDLNVQRVECDELWAFVYSKKKNVPEHLKGKPGFGDVWTWIAIDPDSKLVISWFVGNRRISSAKKLLLDLSSRVNGRIQLSTDKLKSYKQAVDAIFGNDIDYAQIKKFYDKLPKDKEDQGEAPEEFVDSDENEKTKSTERKYSPPDFQYSEKTVVTGNPNESLISTSIVERANLSIRMSSRRFTRLTNAFSKTYRNHCHQIALNFVYYNFIRIHQTLRVTPAMEAGLVEDLWTFEDIVRLIDKK